MHVYIIEGENLDTFSTARKAIQKALDDGHGDSLVFVSENPQTGKVTEYPLSNIKRAIGQLNANGFIRANAGGPDDITIVQRRVN